MIGPTNNSHAFNKSYEADLTLKRLQPRIDAIFQNTNENPASIVTFQKRLHSHWRQLFDNLYELYGGRYDFFFHLEQIVQSIIQGWLHRPADLRKVDDHRQPDPDWFQSNKLVGGALYVDLFSENLGKLKSHIPYLQDLGINYLHLMPLFAVRPGNNDGGYAISNYRSINPQLGSIDDLKELSKALRKSGIVLVLDFVFNHTADDHQWAQWAQSGDPEYQAYYHVFPDRTIPDQYERTLREIFPTVRRGNFTWHAGMQAWVWTTFNSFQWDLNYHNPAVFNAMMGELLYLANCGVDIMRLDAVAFIWKQMGTNCENLPQAHLLIQAMNRIIQICAPAVVFKSEAIVHPDEIIKYIGDDECQLSYNPTLMALMWESLATRKVELLVQSLSHRHALPNSTTWVNYLRCHDDIGWTFDDHDAQNVGINAYDHRQFLNEFYTGQFPGSFARGIPFQYNVATGDMRISGTLASLAGLEQAIVEDNAKWKRMAVKRIVLLHGVTLSIGGIPLLYIGEEWGMLNDYDFVKDPAKAGDSRWVHRPKMKWEQIESLNNSSTVQKEIFESIRKLITLRKSIPALSGIDMQIFDTHNPHVLGFIKMYEGFRLIVIANFSDSTQLLKGNTLRTAGLGRYFNDRITDQTIPTSEDLPLDPYQLMWLESC